MVVLHTAACLSCFSFKPHPLTFSSPITPSRPPSRYLPNLRIRKIQLRMLLHKLLHQILLLLLLTSRFSHLLLLLIIHHLLNHTPCLSVQITEFTVLRHDFLDVDLGGVGGDVGPPG